MRTHTHLFTIRYPRTRLFAAGSDPTGLRHSATLGDQHSKDAPAHALEFLAHERSERAVPIRDATYASRSSVGEKFLPRSTLGGGARSTLLSPLRLVAPRGCLRASRVRGPRGLCPDFGAPLDHELSRGDDASVATLAEAWTWLQFSLQHTSYPSDFHEVFFVFAVRRSIRGLSHPLMGWQCS